MRWVLVIFLLSTDEPQLVRRCANLARDAAGAALAAEDEEDEEEGERRREGAHAALATALALAPSDFQLHHDRGLLLMEGGDTLGMQPCRKSTPAPGPTGGLWRKGRCVGNTGSR